MSELENKLTRINNQQSNDILDRDVKNQNTGMASDSYND